MKFLSCPVNPFGGTGDRPVKTECTTIPVRGDIDVGLLPGIRVEDP